MPSDVGTLLLVPLRVSMNPETASSSLRTFLSSIGLQQVAFLELSWTSLPAEGVGIG